MAPAPDPTSSSTRAASTGPAAPTALPSVGARVLAFALILLAGTAGGFIGYAFMELQVDEGSTAAMGIGALIGAVIAAGGVAIVVVLTLRAMGEWKTIKARESAPSPATDSRPPRVR